MKSTSNFVGNLCEYCGKDKTYFNSRKAYYNHPCRNKQEVFCDTCEICFASKQILNIHTESVHKRKLHTCDICQKVFKSVSSLSRHQKCHKTPTQFSCSTYVPQIIRCKTFSVSKIQFYNCSYNQTQLNSTQLN